MMNKHFDQLEKAQSDVIAGNLKGELVRLARLAGGGITSQAQRELIAATLERKAAELGVDSENVRATAKELRTRTR